MRLILISLTLIVIAGGAAFGALNGARVPLDFYFVQVDVPTGVALLLTLAVGWSLGGLAGWLGQVRRLRRDLRQARARLRELESTPPHLRAGGDA